MPAIMLFDRLGTQWHTGFGGPVGLRYEAITETLWSVVGIPRRRRQQALDDLQVLEHAALEQMQQDREAEERKQKGKRRHG